VLDVLRQTYSLLTVGAYDRPFPVWTRDGQRITYHSGMDIFWKRADGTGGEELVTKEPAGRKIPTAFSPDGKEMAFLSLSLGTSASDIYILSLEGERKARPFLQTSAYEGAAQFSPNGRLMAYVSDETGQREVYVTPYPGPGSRTQVSAVGGTHPQWNSNGRELFYRNGNRFMSVTITESPQIGASTPQLLFEGSFTFGSSITLPNYSVSRDGQRFAMIRDVPGKETRINVVVNWFEELRRAIAADRN
jgi:Tol biopolymer transport system component